MNMNSHRLNSGLTDFDNATGGLAGGHLITIAGRPAMGKTAFAITLMVNIGIEQQIPVAFFSIEMCNIKIVKHILKNWSFYDFDCQSVDSEDIKHTNYQQELCKLSESPIYLDDTPSISINEIEDKITSLISNYGVKVVFIDYLQLIRGFEENPDDIMRRLKAIAIEKEICIISLSQLYNKRIPSEEYEFDDSFFKDGTNAIMNNCDIVALLYRPYVYNDDAEMRFLKGQKHKNNIIPLSFIRDQAMFTARCSDD